ncbi:LAFE_0C07492g1_1 [Lachancea fermentati]|uniref:Protein HRI1 n=1 Tax=Lachancea fermentati TaxID=4955 RepID=A0A1G4M9R4_LACFM|nr:LAFE_0C07492g1_1 [Lachancea fermentati]
MVSINKRLTFQVATNPADERTLTLSSTTNKGHFISLRPFVRPTESEKDFPYEWAFAGTSSHAKSSATDGDSITIDFNFQFDTNVYLNKENTHRGEVHTLWTTWESGCVEERGKVFPFGAENEGVDFFELWQPIDATRDEFVILGNESEQDPNARSIALTLNNGEFEGLIVVVGKWAQGILFKKNDHTTKGVNILRAVEKQKGQWQTLLKYGADFDKFPVKFEAEEGASVVAGNATWEVIESNV